MPHRPSVLFVCLGNICRSPLAEGAFRHVAGLAGLDVGIDSAGTARWHAGNPPDPRAILTARGHGVDISGLRARQLALADFHGFTHIFALDRDNLANIRRMAPANSVASVELLLDLVEGRTGQGVIDPYYGEQEGFEQSWADVSAAAHALVERLSR